MELQPRNIGEDGRALYVPGACAKKMIILKTTNQWFVTSDAALYIPASPTPSPPHPHLLARCGEGTCLHIYSTQAGDRDTMLHNHTLCAPKVTTDQIYSGIGMSSMSLCQDCGAGQGDS